MIIFGVVLTCHLTIEKVNFNDYSCLFLVVPSLADVIINKINVFNLSLFITSTSILEYFVFNSLWACLIVLAILIGMILLFDKYLRKDRNEEKRTF